MMRTFLTAAAVVALCCGTAMAEGWGSLTGRFVYDGEAPTPAKVELEKPDDIQNFGNANLTDDTLLVGSEGGLANVVVYLRTKKVDVHPSYDNVAAQVMYDNRGARFVPRILTLWLDKQTVLLGNADPVAHNTNVQPLGDTGINPLLSPNQTFEHTFKRAQNVPVSVGCNIHPWMKGYILPRDNPYATVSAEDGTFTIENLPAGELEFQAWQEKAGYLEAEDWTKGRFTVTIEDGETTDLGAITLDPKLFEK